MANDGVVTFPPVAPIGATVADRSSPGPHPSKSTIAVGVDFIFIRGVSGGSLRRRAGIYHTFDLPQWAAGCPKCSAHPPPPAVPSILLPFEGRGLRVLNPDTVAGPRPSAPWQGCSTCPAGGMAPPAVRRRAASSARAAPTTPGSSAVWPRDTAPCSLTSPGRSGWPRKFEALTPRHPPWLSTRKMSPTGPYAFFTRTSFFDWVFYFLRQNNSEEPGVFLELKELVGLCKCDKHDIGKRKYSGQEMPEHTAHDDDIFF